VVQNLGTNKLSFSRIKWTV